MNRTALELFYLGGWAMWPLLFFSIATVSIIVDRIIFFIVHRTAVTAVATAVVERLHAGCIDEARAQCTETGTRVLVGAVFLAAIEARARGKRHVPAELQNAAAHAVRRIERGLDLLVAIGSIAPITGFLGTVSGMIAAFSSIAQASEVNAQLVAGGIFEALITTAFGLAIAIVAISAYNIFAHVADRFAADVEATGTEIVGALLAKKR